MLNNFGELVKKCKTHLKEYLEEQGIQTSSKLFKCPNFSQGHNNLDAKPSANFYPNEQSWHCFSCSYKSKLGDIFDAVSIFEGKDIQGENFFFVVKYLCDKYKIPYTETNTDEERFFKDINNYLEGLITAAYTNLKSTLNGNTKLKALLNKKQWNKSIDTFKLGYLDKPYITSVEKDVLSYLHLDPLTLVGRLIIPIRNARGKFVGITTRSLELDKTSNITRYKHFISYSLKKVLYNVDTIDNSKPVIVVEGPSSVLTLYEHGITNVVATFGNLMQPDQYSLLIKKKVKSIDFMYDGDAGGYEGLRNSLKALCNGGIPTVVSLLKDDLDPGDYVMANKTLDLVARTPLYNYLVDSYATNTSDKVLEKGLIDYVNSTNDLVKKEKLINEASKTLKINKSTILDLISQYSKRGTVNMAAVLKERDSLLDTLTSYEKWSWTRGKMLGLKSFSSFDKKLDGIQNGLILLGGRPNIGKSALLISMAVNILQRNPNTYMLYFTIDDSMFVTISRLVANISNLPINIVSNPNYRITKADIPTNLKEEYIAKREDALKFLRDNTSCFNIKDNADGATIEQIKEKVNDVIPLAEGKQLVIVIDNLHNLRSTKFVSDRHLYSLISNELNRLSNDYNCPVIASTHVTKQAIQNKQYDGSSIKETVELYFDAKLILFIDTDEEDLEGTRDDLEVKVIVSKNKFSGFKGNLPFTFYRSLSKVKDQSDNSTSGPVAGGTDNSNGDKLGELFN